MKAAEAAKLMELAPMGILNLEDPANKKQFLDKLDVLGFTGSYGKDVNRAEWENDMLDNLASDPSGMQPIVLDVDNHDVHIAVHGDREKEPSFLELPAEVQTAYAQHRMQHEQLKAQAEMMQMQQAMMTGQPPQPQANPMMGQESIRKGSGIPAKAKNALNPDLMAFGQGTRG
jgi:hypothetical protein